MDFSNIFQLYPLFIPCFLNSFLCFSSYFSTKFNSGIEKGVKTENQIKSKCSGIDSVVNPFSAGSLFSDSIRIRDAVCCRLSTCPTLRLAQQHRGDSSGRLQVRHPT